MAVVASAVIVTLRAGPPLHEAVASVERALARVEGETEMVVVDNGSGAGALREHFPKVEIIAMPRNVGFPAGVNEGLRHTSGDWVLLLNDDATIAPEGVRDLLEAVAALPDVGSAAAQMRFSRSGLINSAGIEVDRLGVASDRLVGQHCETSEKVPTEVFGASAGAALMRRAMLEDIGGFDGSFFVFLEDADVAWRARMRGWRCLYVPSAVVLHDHSATAGQGSSLKHFHVGRNRVRLLAKNADSRLLLRHGLEMAAHDLAHCAYVLVADRTLAALRGRVAGLREWGVYRRAVPDRRPVALSPRGGLISALRRRRAASAQDGKGLRVDSPSGSRM